MVFCLPSGILESRLSWYDIVYQFRDHMGHRYQNMFKEYEKKGTPGKKLTPEVLNASFPDCACDCPAACTNLGYEMKIEQGAPLNPKM